MDRYWKVISRRGNRMNLECDEERRVITCPTKPFAKQLFMMMRPGQFVDDKTLELFEKARLPIKH